jgi:hypothetical protein
MKRISASAVLRLITNSNFSGRCIGKSFGLAPCRIFRHKSRVFGLCRLCSAHKPLNRRLYATYRHSEPSAITWLGWHHCPRWHSTGGCPELQLHVHAVGWPTAQAGIMCLCLAWATPMDMAIASSATEQVFSMSRPPCAAKTVLYRAEKFLGNRSRAPQYLAPVKQVEYSTGFP